jgi:hypothetical protein
MLYSILLLQYISLVGIHFKKVSVNLSDPEGAQLLLNPARIDQFKGATHIVQSVHYGCVIASVFTILPGRKEFVDLDRVQQVSGRGIHCFCINSQFHCITDHPQMLEGQLP